MTKSNGADLGKELIKFYEKKAQADPGGGKFFQVNYFGSVQTVWAKNLADLVTFLKENKIKYNSLIPLT